MGNRWYKKGENLLREIRETALPDSILSCWYIGQMGVILKWKHFVLFLDPVLNDLYRTDGSSRRTYEIPFLPDQVTGVLAVLGTHDHADHINMDTLGPLLKANPLAGVVIPRSVEQSLIQKGLPAANLTGACAGTEIRLTEEIVITPVAAAHERYETDEEGNFLCLGYVIQLGAFRIYHAGDTLVTPDLLETLAVHKPFHMAYVPINGMDEERHQRGIIGNMGCRDAVYLVQRIEADMTIPMHYDMVAGNGENPLMFADCMHQYAPDKKYHIMKLGERFLCAI